MTRALMMIGLMSLACSGGSGLLGNQADVVRPEAARVAVDLAVMDALSPAELAALEQHLTASAAWTVRDEHDRRIATRNWVRSDERWEGSFNGYWSNFSLDSTCHEMSTGGLLNHPRCASAEALQVRVLLALGQQDRLTHGDRGQFTRAPVEGEVVLALEDYMDQPGRNSWLVVQGERLMVEVMEQADPDARPFTQAAVDSLRDELLAVQAGVEAIERRGFLESWAPPDGWTDGDEPPLTLTAGERPGRYDLTLAVNASAPGALDLRLIHVGLASDGELPGGLTPGDEVSMTHQLPTRLGWGADDGVRFTASTPVWVERGTPGEAIEGRLEVVFTPDDGGPERVLASLTQDFTGRESKNPPSPSHQHGRQ